MNTAAVCGTFYFVGERSTEERQSVGSYRTLFFLSTSKSTASKMFILLLLYDGMNVRSRVSTAATTYMLRMTSVCAERSPGSKT